MVPDSAMRSMMRDEELDAELLGQTAIAGGMLPLVADGASKILAGVTSVAEVAGATSG